MIHKYKILIIMALVLMMLSNSIIQPKRASAEVVTLTAGLYVFLSALAAAGVTYVGATAVNNLVDEGKLMYDEYKKWLDTLPEYDPERPPNEPQKPPQNWEKFGLLAMLGISVGGHFKNIIDSVKDFLFIRSDEYDNDYVVIYPVATPDIGKEYIEIGNNSTIYYPAKSVATTSTEIWIYDYVRFSTFSTSSSDNSISVLIEAFYRKYNKKTNKFLGHSTYSRTSEFFNVTTNMNVGFTGYGYVLGMSPKSIFSHGKFALKYVPDKEPILQESSNVNFDYDKDNSYIKTDNYDDIKPVIPKFDYDKLPEEKLNINPDGTKIYEGTEDEFLADLLNTVDPNDMFEIDPLSNPLPTPIPIPEGGGFIIPTADPGGNPDPGEDPDPGGNPDPGGDPDLDPDSGGNPDPGGMLDTDVDVDLDVDKLKKPRQWSLKFPFSIPWDLARVIGLFSQPPEEPELGINIDTSYLKLNYDIDLDLIGLPIRFLRYVATAFFVFWLAGKTRDVIKW